MSNEPTVAQELASALARHGVDILFAQSLPSMLALSAEDLGIRQFAYRTENAGAAMADGFARVSGKVGVVMAQNGPAATLLVPGLAEALKASVPVVALVQDVNRAQADRNAFQELDHVGLFTPVAKWVKRVTEASRAVDYLDMAFAMAASGRPGPAVLLLPADLLLERMKTPSARQAHLGTYPLDRASADPMRVAEAAELLASAKRPLVVAGGGVHLSGASAEVAALQAEAHLPVMTTVMGKGAVDERHPLSLGVTGYALGAMAPGQYLRPLIECAGVVLLIGTRTNQNGTDSWALYPGGAKYIHIDVDPAEIGRNYEALRLAGDARLTLAALIEKLRGHRRPDTELEQAIADARARHAQDIEPLIRSDASPVHPVRMMADMQQVLTPDSIVVADASYATLWVACYLRALRAGMRFLTPRGLAGLGWGLPLALGARMARPDQPVLCVVGDGGFAHVWSELETAHRMRAKIVLTVLNNGVLAYQKDAEDVKFGRHTSAVRFAPVDHAQIARACGCRGLRIERVADYLPALREALAADETTVLDVVTDPQAYPPITLFDGTLERVRGTRKN